MSRVGNRLAKAGIIVAVLGVVGGTGWLAGNGAAEPPAPSDPLPSVDLSPKVITVGKGTIVSRITVDAVVRADPPVPVRVTKSGTVTTVHRKNGQRVNKGERLLTVKVPGEDEPGEDEKDKPTAIAVTAPASGRISNLTARVGQELAPSDPVAQLDRGRYQAVATISSKEIYKLYNRPESIKMAIDHGPAPFTCRLLAYGAGVSNTAPSGQPEDPSGEGTQGGSGGGGGDNVEVTCRIPRRQKVFAGIRGKMAITTDSVTDAVVIPLSAVLGEASKGKVTVVGGNGEREVRDVGLGINDGKRVEIVDGLEPGDKILDRAPDNAAFDVPAPPQEGGGGPEAPVGGS
ncbi:efflux RND transporter periplasmic adaptor subunit [Actinomadura sp. 9N215]|uniref:efflux RND transporter periplasmic adaptor subunit n=1 Tax=Actinomadura sp. 9N215 TaxID=3375150 RepID=UPI0037B4B860